jgi:hypothetical protein
MFAKATIPLIARPYQKVAHDESFRLWDEGVSGVLNCVFHWRPPPENVPNAGACAVWGNDLRLPQTHYGQRSDEKTLASVAALVRGSHHIRH